VYEFGIKFMQSGQDELVLRGQEKAELLAMHREWLGIPADSPEFQKG